MAIQETVLAVVLSKGAIATPEIPGAAALEALQSASPIMAKHLFQVGLAIW
jgi:hypothetical protein